MLFNSYIFILLFLPVTLLVYFSAGRISKKTAQMGLILMSFVFYGYNHLPFVLLLMGSIVGNYLISRMLVIFNDRKWRRSFLVLGIVLNIVIIFYFKYFNFFLENIDSLLGRDFIARNIVLPLGISFFTFQQVSFLVDSYNGKTKNYDFIEYALFVCFFPQLVAGPIVRHNEMISQFRDEQKSAPNYANIARGIIRFSIGLAKKVLIADTFSIAVKFGFDHFQTDTCLDIMLTMLAYTFQIYFDFSGYCDMASGIARMFNFTLPENFNSPYKALSINDFWRRWHMTLTGFLRDYIYYPLGGSRKGKVRTYWNVMVVFLVSGIWHGANWTFILWGLLHGIFCVIDRLGDSFFNRMPKVIRWLLTFAIVNVLWLLFRADDITQWITMLSRLSDFSTIGITPEFRWIFETQILKNHVLVAGSIYLIGFIGCLCLENNGKRVWAVNGRTLALSVMLVVWCVLSFSGVSEFLYFNF